MFGFLKNLLGGKSEPAKPAPAPPPPAKPATPAEAKSAPAEPAKPASKSGSPAPAAAPAAPVAPTVPVENVTITFAGVVKKLPQELQDKVKSKPGPSDMVTLGIKKLAEQLQQGSVKITLGELQKACPANTFNEVEANDQTMIELPLAEILSKISPNLLTRRANQKKVEIPSDVVGLFSNSGGAISSPAPSTAAPKPAAAAPAPTPAPAPAPAPVPPPAAPAPAPAPAPEAAAPIQISSSLRDAMSAASASAAATPAPPLKPTGTAPSAPAPAKLPTSTAPKPPAPAAAAPAAAPAGADGVVTVPVAAVSANWPDAIKQEVAKAGPDAKLDLPAKNVGDNLRMGKLTFPWKLLRTWVKPAALSAPSPQDETAVDLPLAVVAPLFMAMKPVMRTQKKVTVDEKIPDMFAGRSAAHEVAVAPAPAPAPEAPAAVATPAPAPAAPAAAPQPSGWTAKEMVQKASALPGMSGAVIALQDGLVVECQLPASLKGETFAGFLPQIFSRINQYTNEMGLGELNGLTLLVNNVPCQISKAGGVYFAALGRAGEPLPTVQLNVIAAELGRQNNK